MHRLSNPVIQAIILLEKSPGLVRAMGLGVDWLQFAKVWDRYIRSVATGVFSFTLLVADCGALPNPANGMVTFKNTNFGTSATYSCITSYTLNGGSIRTCPSGGIWGGSPPTCDGEESVTEEHNANL